MKFKKGQIVFFKNDGFFSKAIGLRNLIEYDHSDTTHVGIITDIKRGEVYIHEALSKGVTPSWYPNEFLERGLTNGDIHIGEVKYKLNNLLEIANKYNGKPYGFLDILAIILSFFFKFRFIRLTGSRQVICSEFVARILYEASNKKIDFQAEYGKLFDLIDPQNIFDSKQVNILKN